MNKEYYELLEALIKKLINEGYPSVALFPHWQLGNFTYDLVVIDPKSNVLISMFELSTEIITNHIVGQPSNQPLADKMGKFETIRSKTIIPSYLVEGLSNNFRISQLFQIGSGGSSTFVEIKELPRFEEVKNRILTKEVSSLVSLFQIICWIIAFITFVLLICNWFNILLLTPERLALIGVIIAMIVFPYSQKIKVLGIEIERKN